MAWSALIFASCTTARVEAPRPPASPARTFQLPAPDLSTTKRLSLWATYYSTSLAREQRSNGVAIRDLKGRKIGPRIALRSFCDAAMQGTVQIASQNGRVRSYQFAGTVDDDTAIDCTRFYPNHPTIGRSRFRRIEDGDARGARGDRLIPFRSIAADPARIRPRSVIFIPAARGVPIKLASGESFIHDGYFYVADRGGAVKGNHVDIFIGTMEDNPFPFVKSASKATFEAHLIAGDHAIAEELRALHQRDLTASR